MYNGFGEFRTNRLVFEIPGITLSHVKAFVRIDNELFYSLAYSSSNSQYSLLRFDYLAYELEIKPFRTINSQLTSIYGIKYIDSTRAIVVGSYDTFTLANSTSFVFSNKLGVIYDVPITSGPNDCSGITQPLIAATVIPIPG